MEQKFLILMKSNLSFFSFMDHACSVTSKNSDYILFMCVSLHWLELSVLCYTRVLKVDCFVPILGEKQSFIKYSISCSFGGEMLFIQLFLYFWKLYHEQVLNFAKCHFCINQCDHGTYNFSLSTSWVPLVDFQIINQTSCLDKSILIMLYNFF